MADDGVVINQIPIPTSAPIQVPSTPVTPIEVQTIVVEPVNVPVTQVLVVQRLAPVIVLTFTQVGAPTPAQSFALPVAVVDMMFPSGPYPSEAVCTIAPMADYMFTLVDPNNDVLCTITYPAGQKVGNFSWASNVSVSAGEALSVVAPGSSDATFAGANISFAGAPIPN